jgi:hypothetical protein
MNPCKRWHKLTLIEVLLNKVQWHPENWVFGVQIIAGLL